MSSSALTLAVATALPPFRPRTVTTGVSRVNACSLLSTTATKATGIATISPGCTRPWRSTYVTANGNVLPCCFAPFTTSDYEGVILGNLFEQPMAEIWSGAAYEAFRRAHRSDDPPEACRGCGTRWMY